MGNILYGYGVVIMTLERLVMHSQALFTLYKQTAVTLTGFY